MQENPLTDALFHTEAHQKQDNTGPTQKKTVTRKTSKRSRRQPVEVEFTTTDDDSDQYSPAEIIEEISDSPSPDMARN